MRRSVIISVLVASLLGVPGLGGSEAAEATNGEAWTREFEGEENLHSSVTVADVDGNGVDDIVVGGSTGWVRVFRPDGSYLPGWPQRINLGGTHTGIDAAVTVADLDRDGNNEVIVGAGMVREPRQHGGVVAFNRDGSVRWKYRTGDERGNPDGFSDAVFSTPAVGDVDGDRYPEVVFGSFDRRVHVLDRHGRHLPGSPFFTEDTIFSSPALHDIDRDHRKEIFIGGDSSAGGDVATHDGGILWSLEMRDGGIRERWRHNVAEIIVSSPALGDIDGDGKVEVVFGTGDHFKNAHSKRVFALNAEDGSSAPGWPQATNGLGWSSPALGDLDGDGRLDVTIGDRAGHLHAWKGSGQKLWTVKPSSGTSSTEGTITSGPIIADVDGNGVRDVVIASGNAVFARQGSNGALVRRFAAGWQFQASPAVARFGQSWRLVASGYLDSKDRTVVTAYDIPKPGKGSPWPMFGKDAAHTAAPGVAPRDAKGGYWILDRGGDVYAFGRAPFLGSIPTMRASNPSIGPARGAAITRTTSGEGYWILDEVGGMFSFGDAKFHGSVPGLRARGLDVGRARVIGLAPTSTDRGYWMLDESGGMFSFGDANFHGSVPDLRNQGVRVGRANVIAVAATPTGDGYWLLDANGGMFAFGDANFHGSVPGLRRQGVSVGRTPIVGMAATSSGRGYWLVDRNGGMFAFGDATFHGSIPDLRRKGVRVGDADIVAMVPTTSGKGYWLLTEQGGVFSFGDARFHGSLPEVGVSARAVGLAQAK